MAIGRRRQLAHVAPMRAIVVVLGTVVVAALLAIAWFIRAPLPKVDGVAAAPGASAEIVIRRDARGIAHIQASDANDAYYGEGYACAQDRLWQMDLLRREAEGKLSEVLGPSVLSVDKYFRTLGLGELARS